MDTPEGPILGRYASCPVAGAVSHSGPLWDTGPGAILRHLQVVAGTMTFQAGSGFAGHPDEGLGAVWKRQLAVLPPPLATKCFPIPAPPRTHRGSSVKP